MDSGVSVKREKLGYLEEFQTFQIVKTQVNKRSFLRARGIMFKIFRTYD